MFKQKQPGPAIGDAVARAVNYETSIADLAARSERRAWWVAATASTLALLLGAGYFKVMPLKERVPFLVMADASSGNATVARLDENFRHRSLSASEAIARANVASFITLRESYDVAMMNLRDWRAVHAMSAPEVGKEYAALHAANNPSSPFSTYGRSRAIRVRILSIQLIDGPDGIPSGATVRFQRSVYDKASGATRPLDSRIATLGFGYNLALRMDEPDRLENPLGFQVTSYRVDADFAAVPPAESEPEVFSSAPSAEEPVNPLPVMGDGPAVSAQAEGAP
ncbi:MULTISPECIES: type IV secretion system protein [unclassified Luteimonas]|uniref:virB8 family protein n=1 Tax=unclassified Luteimonas TaxID=2629088 RepID=UPI0018F10084|nr:MULTISPECIES: type IV secretion system protein [unclassified Luteimonas]MBJ6979648.1 type IV secretion system protein [Luteimonas sp. MC1895]MBJ6983067.1 type IV secretion system protein [Luteimonas sp. MC1750]QQO05220.1 type IV secretion system protein [Luteimonas sp. MC1750]